MSVPDQLAQMSSRQLQEMRARAAVDVLARPEVNARLGEHIQREVAARAARN